MTPSEASVTVDITTARPPTHRAKHRHPHHTDQRALLVLGVLILMLVLAGFGGTAYMAHLLAGAR